MTQATRPIRAWPSVSTTTSPRTATPLPCDVCTRPRFASPLGGRSPRANDASSASNAAIPAAPRNTARRACNFHDTRQYTATLVGTLSWSRSASLAAWPAMMASDMRRCPPGVRVHAIFPAASHRRMVRVHTPNMDAAMPILTHVSMIPCIIHGSFLSHDIIQIVFNLVQENVNCQATPRLDLIAQFFKG